MLYLQAFFWNEHTAILAHNLRAILIIDYSWTCQVEIILLLTCFYAITALGEATMLDELFDRLYLIIAIIHG